MSNESLGKSALTAAQKKVLPSRYDAPAGGTQSPSALGFVRREDGTMQYGKFSMTPTSLVIPDGTDQDEWKELGNVLFNLDGAISWWLGDYAVYGERTWKFTYDALAKAYNKEVETLYTYAGVARSINSSIRNRGLSFAHHRLVQGLEDEQEQRKWLDLALSKGWTVQQMTAAMKPVRPSNQAVTPYDELFTPERFPALKANAVKKLVVKAKSGDQKALKELAAVVQQAEQWLSDLRDLFEAK